VRDTFGLVGDFFLDPRSYLFPYERWGVSVVKTYDKVNETSLNIEILSQFHTYSDPSRDPRHHTITTVYIAKASGIPKAADDATETGVFCPNNLPHNIVFDHRQIIEDYYGWKKRI